MTDSKDKPSFLARLVIVATIAGVLFQLVLCVGGVIEKMSIDRAYTLEQREHSDAEVKLNAAIKKGGAIHIDDLPLEATGRFLPQRKIMDGRVLLYVCLFYALSYLAVAGLYYIIKGKPTNADAAIASRLYRVWGVSVIVGAIYSFLI